MIQFLSKIAISAVFLVLFIYVYGSFCNFFFTQDRFLDLSEKKQWVLAQKGNSVDYAILGSSRAYGAFDMVLLDSLTGKSGINLGSNGSGFKDNYLVLTHFLKSNSTKELYLQVDMHSLNSKESFSNEFHAFTFMPYWEDEDVKTVLKEELPVLDNWVSDVFPEWRYFYFNKYFSPKEIARKFLMSSGRQDPYSALKGGMSSSSRSVEVAKVEIALRKAPEFIDQDDWKYLQTIIQLAEKKEIDLKLFTAPIYLGDHVYLKKAISDLRYVQIVPDQSIEVNKSLFQDQGHLNNQGRYIFTKSFFENLDTQKNASL
ncbi:hypothetical protein SYJ56_23650 [Algoriphagus sp. D3-2-R+10]|uniref:hypothetical protein n=1 Tax=Algoriphagus aurantiacus TaxID=3103948 RepID=UPI002B3691E8|nr:hypothetical protein [Algoriphagus sp. D3-2-R+10]MEB2778326.1 hypothetical protein [Algoriphagus sp. D3-2-R+10]